MFFFIFFVFNLKKKILPFKVMKTSWMHFDNSAFLNDKLIRRTIKILSELGRNIADFFEIPISQSELRPCLET